MGTGFGTSSLAKGSQDSNGLMRITGPRRPLRDHLTSTAQRCRSRCVVRLGSARLHHREGQGDEAVTKGKARLNGNMARGGVMDYNDHGARDQAKGPLPGCDVMSMTTGRHLRSVGIIWTGLIHQRRTRGTDSDSFEYKHRLSLGFAVSCSRDFDFCDEQAFDKLVPRSIPVYLRYTYFMPLLCLIRH